jgi:hypothetical protein
MRRSGDEDSLAELFSIIALKLDEGRFPAS